MARLLYTSSEVRKHITNLFSSRGRRVAISAFVGNGADSYLQRPRGIELICWPKAGGTNPNEIRKLIDKGAIVSFCDCLHIKLYWSERGCIVTSANLSTNALGSGYLKEAGVLLPKGICDIDRVITSLRIRAVTAVELKRLDREHKVFARKFTTSSRAKDQTFDDWYQSSYRSDWKLGWWDEPDHTTAASTSRILKREYEIEEPQWTQACAANEWKKHDWVLSFRLNKRTAGEMQWMYIDFMNALTKSEKKTCGWPCEGVQVWPSNRYSERPFVIDATFRSAFRKAVTAYGLERIKNMRTAQPPARLLSLIKEYYSSDTRH